MTPVIGRIEQLTTRTRQIQAAIDAAGMGDPQKARITTLEAENVALRAVEVAARGFMDSEVGWATYGPYYKWDRIGLDKVATLRDSLAALDATRLNGSQNGSQTP